MASIVKRNDSYSVVYRYESDGKKKQKWEGGLSYKEAVKRKAQIEAQAQRIQREVVDEKVLALRKLENERAWIETWDGKLPGNVTMLGDSKSGQFILNLPK